MKQKKNVIFILLGFLLFSCIPQHRIEYLEDQTINNIKSDTKKALSESTKIKANDELLINISTFDDMSFNYFDNQNRISVTQASSELSLSALSYSVNDSGYIYFPILGNFQVGDLTLSEASVKLKNALATYFEQPKVTVRFAYKKITILGEVNSPGYHTFSKNNLNIFEALGLANDLTIHANRNEVKLVRDIDGTTHSFNIDLSKSNIISSEFYYVEPDDVIIVNPRKSAKWNVVSVPMTLVFSTISTTLLIINYISSNK